MKTIDCLVYYLLVNIIVLALSPFLALGLLVASSRGEFDLALKDLIAIWDWE